jgi:hypothetical protein
LLHDFDGKGGGILRPSDLLALLAPANAGQTLVILDI